MRVRYIGAALPLIGFAVLSLSGLIGTARKVQASPTVVRLVKESGGFKLLRDGKPYIVKGAGGSASKVVLKEHGGNSFRTWGADNIKSELDEAEKLGLSVTIGIWLGHKEHGFDWHNEQQVSEQLDRAKRNVLEYKDHPALLIWALGNEMEQGGMANDPVLWQRIEEMAAMMHKLDPNHPTMTVVAELGGNTVQNIHKYCPDIDIIGINSYAGCQSIPERYAKNGGTKPYLITEFGPPGTWEFWKKTPWGAMDELTSAEKVEWYKKPYVTNVVNNSKLCLGAYAFTWGSKQEASATWFGMLLPDGTKLNAVDAMTELWTGKPDPNPCPDIQPLKIDGPRDMNPDTPVTVHLNATDPNGGPLKVHWLLTGEPKSYNTGGETEKSPPSYPESIVQSDNQHASLKISSSGRYRLYAYVYNNHGGAAMANLALNVKDPGTNGSGSTTAAAPAGGKAVGLYGSAIKDNGLWTPSGYMGNTAAIKMDPACSLKPHSGNVCLKAEYTADDNWGGVVWQDPANDWGKLPGGHDLTGAKRLTFWARGDKGGETVSFSFGLLDSKAKYHDSDKGELKDVRLTTDWKQYHIDLTGKDLTCIKTGFCWTLASKATFYLDDIQYEGITEAGAPKFVAPFKGEKADIPLVIYNADAGKKRPWTPSGYMGNTAAIKMDPACTLKPHSGNSCLKAEYTADDNWGGVVWQDPANDWGKLPGGYDLTGAKRLTFWARGDKGGETVSFSFGLLDSKAKYHDSDKGELKDVRLTTDWKQYHIDLTGKDLTCIKTGFCWTVASKATFYLDDIRFE